MANHRCYRRLHVFVAAVTIAACGAGSGAQRDSAASGARRDTVVLYLAASLTRPLQPIIDSFAVRTHTVVVRESGASLEHARKITELHRVPDLLILADVEVFPRLLVPRYAAWYATFARNRMVVAYTARSRFASDINPRNWMDILARPGVEVGRTDPAVAPVGYRTLLLFALAGRFYRRAGLRDSLLVNAPSHNMRGNAADLAALLEAGQLDYIYDYASVAASHNFQFVQLPPQIDLGDPRFASAYGAVHVRVRSAGRDSADIGGEPILYGLTIPVGAPHPAAAARFLDSLLAPATRQQLRAAHVDVVDSMSVFGTGAPPIVALHGRAGN